MEDLIDRRKRIEAVVCRGENDPREASFLSDRNGCLLNFRDTVSCSEALADIFSGMYKSKPLMFDRGYMKATWEGRSYHAWLNRYARLTLSKLASI